MPFKFPKKLPKEWIEQIERHGKLGSTFKGMKIVAKDKRGTVVKTGKDSFKILHDGENSENFGYDTTGGSSNSLKDKIRGSWFTCPESGTAEKIVVYCKAWSSSYYGNAKCAIYKKSDDSLVGSTQEVYIDWTDYAWTDFTFSDPKPSLANEDYYLVFWTENWSFITYDDEDNKSGDDSEPYNGFPNPWNPVTGNCKYSIYCTYTTAGGQTYEINVDAVVKASADKSLQTTFKITKDAAVTSQAVKTSESTFNISKDAIAKALTTLSFELGIPVEAIVKADATKTLESTFKISKEAIIQALATKILQTTYNIHKDAAVAGTAAHGEESTFTIPKDTLVKALTDLSFELGIPTEAIVKASATPNFELGFPVEAVVKASAAPDLESTFIIRKDALVQALASVIVEKVAGAVIEIFKDAVVNAQATFSLESTFNISKNAISKATATVNTETIFNVVKDAIIKASAIPQIVGVYPINVDAVVKASAAAQLRQTLGISKDAVVVTVSTPLIQSTFNISKEAIVKLLAEVSVVKEGEVKVTKLFLMLGNIAIQLCGD